MGQTSRSRQASNPGMTGACAPRALAGAVAAVVALLAAPAIAQAGVGASAGVATAPSVTVGQAGVAASITMTNVDNGAEVGATNIVCNAAEVAPCLGASENGISLVPSCGTAPGGVCSAGAAEAGVFAVSPVASGRLGSACAGTAFQVALADTATGRVRFVPQPAGAHVLLAGAGSSCVIDFTQSVLRSPAIDASPPTPGIQTLQIVDHTQTSGTSSARALASTFVNVQPATASLSTAASASVAVGGPVTDRATITGLVAPVAGGAVTFRLYAPSSGPACTGTPIFTSTNPVQIAGTMATATSTAFTTTVTGTHRWIATYDGDAHNLPIAGVCGASGESVRVTADGGGATGAPPFPAKLEVARALVSSATRRLGVLAPISARASGRVAVRLEAAGRTTSFTAPVDSAHARVRIDRGIPAVQAKAGTGILTLAYPGDADTQPQEVRLRAASRKALLVARRPTISGGRLIAGGRISPLARGVVRVQLLFEPAGQGTRTLQLSAPIEGGGYRLNAALAPDVLAQIAGRRGAVHSYTLFTGYALARMRGEMASFEVLPAP
jgi:hypothetical protein